MKFGTMSVSFFHVTVYINLQYVFNFFISQILSEDGVKSIYFVEVTDLLKGNILFVKFLF